MLLNNKKIKHLVLTNDGEFSEYLPHENLVDIDWGKLSLKYPDDLKSLHTSYEGHIDVYNSIMKKIKNL